jgi:hypothetical protein
MKKYILFQFLTVIFVTSVILSCKKGDFSEQPINASENIDNYQFKKEALGEFEISTSPVSLETLMEIVESIKNEEGTIIEDPNLIADALSPLVENGGVLHEELISHVSNSEEWLSMSPEEIDSIINITDIQRAQLSFIYALSNPLIEIQAVEAGISVDIIKDCIGVALGAAGIKHLVTTLVTAPTVSTAIGILKWVGKRYLSYLGVAWMVWDFIDCMSHF